MPKLFYCKNCKTMKSEIGLLKSVCYSCKGELLHDNEKSIDLGIWSILSEDEKTKFIDTVVFGNVTGKEFVNQRSLNIQQKRNDEESKRKEAEKRKNREAKEKISQIIVTTGDLKQDYDIIGPVYFQISNKGTFSSTLSTLSQQYISEISKMKQKGTMSTERKDWGFLYGEWSVGQNDFEKAFYIATQEIKKRALILGADAVICMRQDIDLDTNAFAYFYLQMYGTAVKLRNE